MPMTSIAETGQLFKANKLKDAERLLRRAIEVMPDDKVSKERLAECFVRRNDVGRTVSCCGRPAKRWRQAGSRTLSEH